VTQLRSFAMLALLGVGSWLTAFATDRRAPRSSGVAALCIVNALYQWTALHFYLDDPGLGPELPATHTYNTAGFVTALVGFATLIGCFLAGAFAVAVRIHIFCLGGKKVRMVRSHRAKEMV